MYKDKDKQREANRRHAKAYRDRKGMTQGMTEKVPDRIIPDVIPVIPKVTPRSIGLGVDTKGAMVSRYLKGVK